MTGKKEKNNDLEFGTIFAIYNVKHKNRRGV